MIMCIGIEFLNQCENAVLCENGIGCNLKCECDFQRPKNTSSNSDYAKSKNCANCGKLYKCNDVRKHPEWHCEKHYFT